MQSEQSNSKAGLVFTSPYVIHILVFFLYPVGFSLYLVVHRWDLITDPKYVGLRNFRYLMSDHLFWQALTNTLYFLAIHIPLQIIIALALAVALAKPLKGRVFFRATFFLPVMISGAAVTILWQRLYSTEDGLINYVLSLVGIDAVPWLTDPGIAMPAIAIMATWKNLGLYIVFFLAGILAIPQPVYEAAKMEGASSWDEFRYITLPLLKPTMLLVVVLSTLGGFNLFIEPYVMTGGGPLGSTMSVVLYMYKQAFSFQHMGYAATLGFALALIIMVCVFTQKKYLDSERYYS